MGIHPKSPTFVFDDGWFELPWKKPVPGGHYGYKIWDVERRWKAVPPNLRPYSCLELYVPWESITSRRTAGDEYITIEPEPDIFYPQKLAAFQAGIDYAESNGISVILQVRRWSKSSYSRPSYELIENLLKNFKCIKALYYNELGGGGFEESDEEHLVTFTGMAKQFDRQALWSLYFDKSFPAWNALMSNSGWVDFFRRNRETLIPVWKNVEPINNLLLWADCVGMWLSELVADWGFEFDDWYWINYFCHSRGTHRKQFGPAFHGDDTFEMTAMSCPQYLVKDTMILSALTGARYILTEADPSFIPYNSPYGSFGGSLRSVRQKVSELIVVEKLWMDKKTVASNVRLAIETPLTYSDVIRQGYQYTDKEGPNCLFNTVFGVPDGDLCTTPRKAPYFLTPIIPSGKYHNSFSDMDIPVVPEYDLKNIASILSGKKRSPIVTNDPHTLIFDAGNIIYITDNRAEGRLGHSITVWDYSNGEYEFTFLADDATPVKIKAPVVRKKAGKHEFQLCLFAGGSFLLRRLK